MKHATRIRNIARVADDFHAAILLCSISMTLLLSGCEHTVIDAETAEKMSLEGFSLLTFQDIRPADWIVDPSKRIHTGNRTLNFTGKCIRGMTGVEVRIDGNATGAQATCSSEGSFTWSHNLGRDGTIRVAFHPVLRLGLTLTQNIAETLVIDTVPPAPPVITTRQGLDFISGTPQIELDGIVSNDTSSVEGDAINGILGFFERLLSFEYRTALKAGETKTYFFVALDRVGNRSAPTQITISYLPGAMLPLATFSGVGLRRPLLGSGGSVVLESVSMIPLSAPDTVLSNPSNDELANGFLSFEDRLGGP